MVHLRSQGFTVESTDVDSLADVRTRYRVPAAAASCHTAVVGGYVVEGHVPAEYVLRLLKEKPAGLAGLAVPGMPVGSPGMEGPNPQPFDVLSFDKDGNTRVYATHKP